MIDDRIRKKCLNLYLSRYTIDEIEKMTKVSRKTLYNWRQTDKWEEQKKANLTDAERIEKGISGLVLKLIDTAEHNPSKETLDNLDNAVKIYKSTKHSPL